MADEKDFSDLRTVLLYEIGHDQLHRHIADTFHEFRIFDIRGNVMEYAANLFAAQIAAATASDINPSALKVKELSRRGYAFRSVEHRSDFLK